MKKHWHEPLYIKARLRRARRDAARKIKVFRRKAAKREKEIGLSDYEKYKQRNFTSKGYIIVTSPPVFSFIINPEGVSKFIEKLRIHYEKNNKVFVDLANITKIDYDAVVVLLSIMIRFKAKKIDFNGSFPSDYQSKRILEKSGFFENLYKQFRDEDRYVIREHGIISTQAWKNVDSELSAELIKKASQTVWGIEKRCQGVQRILIELMQNTNNHAVIGKSGERHWWLCVNHNKNENKVSFSFVDYGVGIFNNLENKPMGNKFFGWAQKLLQKFKFKNNAELLKLIMDGELHQTVTGKHYRGKGLPGIKDVMDRNQISNLHVITNDVKANILKDDYSTLTNPFQGTFIYWEISKTNTSCDVKRNNFS